MTASVAATEADGNLATVGTAFLWAAGRLKAAGVDTATLDARVLLDRAAGSGRGTILAWRERQLDGEEQARFAGWIDRRAGREPVARILGEKEFWSLLFQLGPETLVPRPDSEVLVEAALRLMPDPGAPARVLDLGTGSGCLLLALLSERHNATGIGIDVSPQAVAVAQANAARLGIADRASFRVGDWGAGLEPPFDLILCNPPYIPSAELASLAREVAVYDPAAALDGGADGLQSIRAAAAAAARLLRRGGSVVMEIGWDQAATAAVCLGQAGLEVAAPVADLGGRARCLVGRRP